MKNLIAVWGNSGSGKSLITCALANELTAKGKDVIVLCTDKLTPMLPVYLPLNDAIPSEESLGKFLSGEISDERLRHTIHIHPKNDHLGFMALASGENGLNYQMNWSGDRLSDLVNLLFQKSYANYVIFDCTCDVLNDSATLFALSKADSVLCILSPDTQAISFFQSQMPILSGGNFNLEHIKILNDAFEYSPSKQLKKDYGIEFVLPHSSGAYSKFTGGQLIKNLGGEDGAKFEAGIKEISRKVVKADG